MLKKILKIINKLITKDSKSYIFFSIPDFQGNSRAYFEYLYKFYPEYNFVWIFSKQNAEFEKKIKNKYPFIKIYSMYSIKSIFAYFKSKYIISTHKSYLGIKVDKQIHIEVWHGMPFKSMGYMENNCQEVLNKENIDLLISTSTLTKNLLAACFQIKGEKIKITGQPRCDYLQKNSKILKQFFNIKDEKVIGYFPTFREGFLSREEGYTINKNNFFRVEDFNEKKFENYLKKNNLKLVMKLHPFEEKIYNKLKIQNNNIIVFTQEILDENLIDLYEILNEVDLLITDYSSIYIDYLLLNKPIIFLLPDFKEYCINRGVLLEPLNKWLPGPIIYTQNDLEKIIDEILIKNIDNYNKIRLILNNYYNAYTDYKYCERLLNEIREY